PNALLKADRSTRFFVEYVPFTGLDECGLEQHLERMLEMQQHSGDPALVVWGIERFDRAGEGGQCLAFEYSAFLLELHRSSRPTSGPHVEPHRGQRHRCFIRLS